MKAVMLMFDSLNRHRLPVYGCDWVKAPNFERLAARTVVFDNFYAGSMPCMPARRELHTGRYNFLHRPWGPLEPYDDSMPRDIRKHGYTSHIYTDHHHYWRDGGANYLSKYTTWQGERGQEADPWIGDLGKPQVPPNPDVANRPSGMQEWVNRTRMETEKEFPQTRTFAGGCRFIETNHGRDNWLLQIEEFDPHEPYFVPESYERLYPEYDFEAARAKGFDDWPSYRSITDEDLEKTEYYKYRCAASISMCDYNLGKVLDLFDLYDLWKDTMLIVNTDHGFLLGEHGWWAKGLMPWYQEIAHTPFFIWDPRSGVMGERRSSLAQTIDIAPTILDYFGVPIPENTQGKPLAELIRDDSPIHDALLFGKYGKHVNVTDGRYIYMRAPTSRDNEPLYAYTLDTMQKGGPLKPEYLKSIEIVDPFSFSKGYRLLKIKMQIWFVPNAYDQGTLLFDIRDDPGQLKPLDDPDIERRMIGLLKGLMKQSDAPPDQYERLGL